MKQYSKIDTFSRLSVHLSRPKVSIPRSNWLESKLNAVTQLALVKARVNLLPSRVFWYLNVCYITVYSHTCVILWQKYVTSTSFPLEKPLVMYLSLIMCCFAITPRYPNSNENLVLAFSSSILIFSSSPRFHRLLTQNYSVHAKRCNLVAKSPKNYVLKKRSCTTEQQ